MFTNFFPLPNLPKRTLTNSLILLLPASPERPIPRCFWCRVWSQQRKTAAEGLKQKQKDLRKQAKSIYVIKNEKRKFSK